MFDFNPVYLMYLLIGVSAAMFAEGVYLLFYNKASYRHNINRRLKVMDDKPDRESVLVQLRRERGLTSGGEYRLPLVSFNKLVLQSGLTIGFGRLILMVIVGMIGAFAPAIRFRSPSTWWRSNSPTRSAASSAPSPTKSPTAPTSNPRCAISISASAPTTFRYSSPRSLSRARPAAISAKSWKTCRA